MKNYPSAVAALKAAEKRGDKEFKVKFMDKKESAKMAKNNRPASEYAKPHTMEGKAVGPKDAGTEPEFQKKKNWVPLMGVSITMDDRVETEGIKIRGTGAATKGVMARGPMA